MRKRRGSSSILVIMICVTIVVFGTFAVVTSANGKKMANINYRSAKNFYELDGRAKEILVFISDIISKDGIQEEVLLEEVSSNFDNVELEFANDPVGLLVEFKVLPSEGRGVSVYRKAEYRSDGNYKVLVEKALSKEIVIDESEEFEIVE